MTFSIRQLWDIEMDQLRKEQGKDPDPELWRWSPLDIIEFDRMLNVAYHIAIDYNVRRRQGLRRILFLEPGCGIGTKLWLAKNKYNMAEYGCDLSEEYIKTAVEMFEVNAEVRDLREWTPPYGAADIVYASRPYKDDDEERAWEEDIQERMRPGAVLISAYTANKPYGWLCHYRYPFHGVWVKPEPRTGNYTQMIQRTVPGPDPLVPEPGPSRAG